MGSRRPLLNVSFCAVAAATLLLLVTPPAVSAYNGTNDDSTISSANHQTATADIVQDYDTLIAMIEDSRPGSQSQLLNIHDSFINRLFTNPDGSERVFERYAFTCAIKMLKRFSDMWKKLYPGSVDTVMMVLNGDLKSEKVNNCRTLALLKDPYVLVEVFLGTALDMRAKWLEDNNIPWRRPITAQDTRAAALFSILVDGRGDSRERSLTHSEDSTAPHHAEDSETAADPATPSLQQQGMQLGDSFADSMSQASPNLPSISMKSGPEHGGAVVGDSETAGNIDSVTSVDFGDSARLQAGMKLVNSLAERFSRVSKHLHSMLHGTYFQDNDAFFHDGVALILKTLTAIISSRRLLPENSVTREFSVEFAKTVFGAKRAGELIPVHVKSGELMTGPIVTLVYVLMEETSVLESTCDVEIYNVVTVPCFNLLWNKTEEPQENWVTLVQRLVDVGRALEERSTTYCNISKFPGLSQSLKDLEVLRESARRRPPRLDVLTSVEGRRMVTGMVHVLQRNMFPTTHYGYELERIVEALQRGSQVTYERPNCRKFGFFGIITFYRSTHFIKNGDVDAENFQPSDLSTDKPLMYFVRSLGLTKMAGPASS
eukprot:GHVQ01009431.1.p1 GENE.GHVQ01009431.1~~GHVQ01009431.1.p1  ORF type:complete len:601 (-),score=61.39 GHVQ01009431.1:390-2192(-)